MKQVTIRDLHPAHRQELYYSFGPESSSIPSGGFLEPQHLSNICKCSVWPEDLDPMKTP